jgi:hypothetical protein
MIIIESILTTFIASIIFGGHWGNSENWPFLYRASIFEAARAVLNSSLVLNLAELSFPKFMIHTVCKIKKTSTTRVTCNHFTYKDHLYDLKMQMACCNQIK